MIIFDNKSTAVHRRLPKVVICVFSDEKKKEKITTVLWIDPWRSPEGASGIFP